MGLTNGMGRMAEKSGIVRSAGSAVRAGREFDKTDFLLGSWFYGSMVLWFLVERRKL